MRKIFTFLVLAFVLHSHKPSLAQVFQSSCNPAPFAVDTVGDNINWTQFPDFSLPFTIIYHGKAPDDSLLHMLNKGFSHVATSDLAYKDTLFPDQRAYTWTGIASADSWANNTGQPWWLIKSPWNNDVSGYRTKWMDRLNSIKNNWYKYNPPSGKWIDILIADLEWSLHLPSGILTIKNDSLVPAYYQSLPNPDFVAEYRKAMVDLYAEPLRLAEDSVGPQTVLTSYAETPIRRTWTGIDDFTWTEWTTDSILVDFLMHDSTGFMSSDFYERHEFICPSIYNFYNVTSTNPEARRYLGYNMFMMEANMAWSSKGQLMYVWTNYHPNTTPNQDAYAPWQAEATAIFPLMNGAIGLYHWVPTRYDVYEYFIYGLYRLSQYAGMFDGNQIYVRPEPGYDSFMNMTPVWRGVVNGNDILITAQNPFAAPGDTTVITVSYNNWSQDIALIGNETFLCQFQMVITETAEQGETVNANVSVQPNPAGEVAQVQIENPEAGNVSLQLFNMMGAYVSTLYNGHLEKGMHHLQLNTSALDAGIYLLKMQTVQMERVVRVVLVN